MVHEGVRCNFASGTETDFFIGADLPGVGYSLNLFPVGKATSPSLTPSRLAGLYDHVGFEVKNLDAFCKALEVKGIKVVRPYTKKETPP